MLVFVGFGLVNSETKAIYFDSELRQYAILVTTKKKVKDKRTKEEYEVYIGMSWVYVSEQNIGVIDVGGV